MTTDLEKQFFSTFRIEKIIPCYKCSMQNTNWDCKRTCFYNSEKEKRYPTITDRHYLELISELSGVTKPHFVLERGVEELKQDILKECIFYNKELGPKVRTLFKEG